MARGACLCGTVRFDAQGPYAWLAHCHCSMCRRHHGSLFSTSLGVRLTRFRWMRGQDRIARYRSSAAFERAFCRDCGSKVPALSQSPEIMNVPAGTLEDDIGIRPRTHIFVGSKAACCTITDSLPQFESYPPGIDLPSLATTKPAMTVSGVTGSCLCRAVAFEVDADIANAMACELNGEEVELGGEGACRINGEGASQIDCDVGTTLEGRALLIPCHCSRCRRSRGAAQAADVRVRSGRFRWTRGAALLMRYELAPDASFRTAFCSDCGSLMPSVSPATGCVSIPAGSLDRL